ncbi:thiol:disulfide interchange protein, partial [Parabacteroides distasonis]
MKRINAIIFALLAVFVSASAQMANPVHGSASLKMLKGNEAEIVFTMSIDAGWHVYSTDMGDSGPISATFNAVKMDGVQTVGKLTPR